MQRIHITGGPGAGKTTLARALAERMTLDLLELDGQGLAELDRFPRPFDYDAIARVRQDASRAFASGDAWISEGSNILVARPLLERAEVIVVLYIPWRVAGYRILARHLKANLAGNNRFPGLRRLYHFWRWSARYYSDSNPEGLNEWGTPNTQTTLENELEAYEGKLARCRTPADIEALMRTLASG